MRTMGSCITSSPPVASERPNGTAALAVLLQAGSYLLGWSLVLILVGLPIAEIRYDDIFSLGGIGAGVVGLSLAWALLPPRNKWEAPGILLEPASEPELFAQIAELGQRAGLKVPAEVYLLNDANAFIGNRRVWGRKRRIMGIGLPLMKVLTVGELRAVIAHEFGHEHRGDLRLGPWVYGTRRAMASALEKMDDNGVGLHLFFNWYARLYMRLSYEVSRAQELHADALAGEFCGRTPQTRSTPRIAPARCGGATGTTRSCRCCSEGTDRRSCQASRPTSRPSRCGPGSTRSRPRPSPRARTTATPRRPSERSPWRTATTPARGTVARPPSCCARPAHVGDAPPHRVGVRGHRSLDPVLARPAPAIPERPGAPHPRRAGRRRPGLVRRAAATPGPELHVARGLASPRPRDALDVAVRQARRPQFLLRLQPREPCPVPARGPRRRALRRPAEARKGRAVVPRLGRPMARAQRGRVADATCRPRTSRGRPARRAARRATDTSPCSRRPSPSPRRAAPGSARRGSRPSTRWKRSSPSTRRGSRATPAPAHTGSGHRTDRTSSPRSSTRRRGGQRGGRSARPVSNRTGSERSDLQAEAADLLAGFVLSTMHQARRRLQVRDDAWPREHLSLLALPGPPDLVDLRVVDDGVAVDPCPHHDLHVRLPVELDLLLEDHPLLDRNGPRDRLGSDAVEGQLEVLGEGAAEKEECHADEP
ncbi:MAG: M48 family metalloprotease [Proteobacteria bacterium]|nr:M48 family metalloprotease [Pseudomonadota bacterium]